MNIAEYISSGIIESYILGLASPEERAEFESMCASYPEILKARVEFENSLERHFLNDPAALSPSPEVKEKILGQIMGRDGTEREKLPAYPLQPVKLGWWRFIAAAAVVLLLGSTMLNYYFFKQYRNYSNKYQELVATQNNLAASNQNLQTRLQNYESALNMMKDPSMLTVKMSSVPTSPSPGSMATVYWDTRTKDVYLLANNLPVANAEKQYQLWAIVDGTPVDAGMVDLSAGMSFVRMKNIPRAQAFAITLEKQGGNKTPTMSAMFVMGKVES